MAAARHAAADQTAELTKVERRVLGRLRSLVRKERQAPTRVELARSLGVSGPTVHQHLQTLALKGAVQVFPLQQRGVFPAEARIDFHTTRQGYPRAVLAGSRRRAAR